MTKKELEEFNTKLNIENKELKKKADITDTLKRKVSDRDTKIERLEIQVLKVETVCKAFLSTLQTDTSQIESYDTNNGTPIFKQTEDNKEGLMIEAILEQLETKWY